MSDPSRLELVIAQCRRAHEHFPSRESREATGSELLVEEIERLRKVEMQLRAELSVWIGIPVG